MRITLIASIGAAIAILISAFYSNAFDPPPQSYRSAKITQTPGAVLRYRKAATTTAEYEIPANTLYVIDSEFSGQGLCIQMKDSDGAGYTFLQVNDGVATFSTTPCH